LLAGLLLLLFPARCHSHQTGNRPLSDPAHLTTPRSDSNGEDLEGYAGAGLYESITMDPTAMVRVDYNDDPITADAAFRSKVGGWGGGGCGWTRRWGGGDDGGALPESSPCGTCCCSL
jgi:hypothetical protein